MPEQYRPEQIPKTGPELRLYPEGHVEEVLRAGEFNMGDLIDARVDSATMRDAGCIYIQTITDGEGDPNERRRKYYLDERYMGDPQRKIVITLDQVQIYHSGFNIRVGEVWRSPIGDTDGKVEAIVRPWTDQYDLRDVTRGTTPPTIVGQEWLQRAAQAQQR